MDGAYGTNETMRSILGRYSCRAFTGEPLTGGDAV